MPMTPWDVTSSIVSTLVAASAVLLGIGCLWPLDRPPRTTNTPTPPRCQLRPTAWPPELTCATPQHPLPLAEAHRCMQLHRDHDCPRKRAAYTALVAAGRITPDSTRRHP